MTILETKWTDTLPEIGRQYDWHCPDVGIIRVTVVGHAPQPSDPTNPQVIGVCRVQYDRGLAWAAISDLHELVN